MHEVPYKLITQCIPMYLYETYRLYYPMGRFQNMNHNHLEMEEKDDRKETSSVMYTSAMNTANALSVYFMRR